jgi:hypothetical protein
VCRSVAVSNFRMGSEGPVRPGLGWAMELQLFELLMGILSWGKQNVEALMADSAVVALATAEVGCGVSA